MNSYVSSGLIPIDNSTGATANSSYVAAGLVPNDGGATPLTPSFSDSYNLWSDSLLTFSHSYYHLTFTDNLNAWADSASIGFKAHYFVTFSDFLNLWSDSLSVLEASPNLLFSGTDAFNLWADSYAIHQSFITPIVTFSQRTISDYGRTSRRNTRELRRISMSS